MIKSLRCYHSLYFQYSYRHHHLCRDDDKGKGARHLENKSLQKKLFVDTSVSKSKQQSPGTRLSRCRGPTCRKVWVRSPREPRLETNVILWWCQSCLWLSSSSAAPSSTSATSWMKIATALGSSTFDHPADHNTLSFISHLVEISGVMVVTVMVNGHGAQDGGLCWSRFCVCFYLDSGGRLSWDMIDAPRGWLWLIIFVLSQSSLLGSYWVHHSINKEYGDGIWYWNIKTAWTENLISRCLPLRPRVRYALWSWQPWCCNWSGRRTRFAPGWLRWGQCGQDLESWWAWTCELPGVQMMGGHHYHQPARSSPSLNLNMFSCTTVGSQYWEEELY